MTTNPATAVSAAVLEAINSGDYDAFDRLMAPDLAAEFRRAIIELKQAFPDYAGQNELYVAEGDRVVSRWVSRGTHRGEFLGIPATDKQITFTGISIDRIADGKVVESIIEMDMLGVLRQLDAPGIPPG